jgi:hypothetical protein
MVRASGNAPALLASDSAYKAVLFELRALAKARNAVDLHHLPAGTHSLAPRVLAHGQKVRSSG